MKFATVAVITRTKDRPTFLHRAIKSIHGQTYKDFIHVIYNDGGDTTGVDAVLREYDKTVNDRIVVIHGKGSNHKEDSLFNPAITSVDSTYIAIHDDDDTWHPEFLEHTVNALQKSSSGGVVVRTDKITEKIDNNTIRYIKSEQWMPDMKTINLYRQCTENQMTAITFLYRRDVYKEIGGYDDDLAVCGDWDFGIRFLMAADVDYIDPGFALANYHHRQFKKGAEGNTSGAGNDRFAYYTNLLLNKYLRQELRQGRLGVGYIMSKHRFDESYLSRLTHKMLPKVIAKKMKRRAQS